MGVLLVRRWSPGAADGQRQTTGSERTGSEGTTPLDGSSFDQVSVFRPIQWWGFFQVHLWLWGVYPVEVEVDR